MNSRINVVLSCRCIVLVLSNNAIVRPALILHKYCSNVVTMHSMCVKFPNPCWMEINLPLLGYYYTFACV